MSDGSSYEHYGTAAHDADDYDVAMTEVTGTGMYSAPFDEDDVIPDGTYRVVVYRQLGANPADTDVALAEGEVEWPIVDPTAVTLDTVIDRIRHTLGPWR